MVFLPKRSRKNLSKMKNFDKFTIFKEWLEFVEMPNNTNVTTFVLIKKTRKKLYSSLTVGEKVLLLAERIRKKDAPGNLYKSTTENISFFNRDEIFTVKKALLKEDSYNYWISKTADGDIINKKFLRQKLFALKYQFD